MKTKNILLSIIILFSVSMILQNVLADCDYIKLNTNPYTNQYYCGQQGGPSDSICPEHFKQLNPLLTPVCSDNLEDPCYDIDCETGAHIELPPGSFILDFPKNNSQTNLTPVFNWTVSLGVQKYLFAISKEPDFESLLVYENKNLVQNKIVLPSGFLQPQTRYYWRVISQNAKGSTTAQNAPFLFTTAGSPSQLSECNITNASITLFCTDSGRCKEGDKIQMNITVENIGKCLNINKMMIKRVVPEGTISGECYPILENSTPIIPAGIPPGNMLLGNWTVVVSQNCAGKNNVELDQASLFNLSGRISYKDGLFGKINFSTESSEPIDCTPCSRNGVKTQCGACEISSPYNFCKRVGSGSSLHGEWEDNCNDYGLLACCEISGKICSQSGSNEGKCVAKATDCNSNTKNRNILSCHLGAGCYWDLPEGLPDLPETYCKFCAGEQGPETCSSYDNKTTCELDPCFIRFEGCEGTDCRCEWQNGVCRQVYESHGSDPSDCCSCSVNYGTCDQGCQGQENARLKTTTCVDCSLAGGIGTCFAEQREPFTECIGCSFRTNKFPFFMPWQISLVLVLLAAYYMFIIRKNKAQKYN